MIIVSLNEKNYIIINSELRVLPILNGGIVWAKNKRIIAVAYIDYINIYVVNPNNILQLGTYCNDNNGIKHIILHNKLPICFYDQHVVVITKHDSFTFKFDYPDIFDNPVSFEKIEISPDVIHIKFPAYYLKIDIRKRSSKIIDRKQYEYNIIWGDKNKGIAFNDNVYYMLYNGIARMIKIDDFDISLLQEIIASQCIMYDDTIMIGYHVFAGFGNNKYRQCSNKL